MSVGCFRPMAVAASSQQTRLPNLFARQIVFLRARPNIRLAAGMALIISFLFIPMAGCLFVCPIYSFVPCVPLKREMLCLNRQSDHFILRVELFKLTLVNKIAVLVFSFNTNVTPSAG